ncbi:GtrA family protein [Pseudogemmobacter sonorensis]|uniref:GtrA family protein n=1 Tax=Pseudogemmobacter sonorensis TaxID=2989681 RepID=UPI0036C1E346
MSPTRLFRSSFMRFLLVGGVMALVCALLTATATRALPWPRPVTAALVWILCIPPAFWLQCRFTFTAEAPRRGGVALYALTQGLGILIAALAALWFARGAFLHDTAVYLCASALAAVISYLVNRLVIFPVRPA